MKAIFCSGCGDLVGLPPSRARTSIRQCECGRVRGRWVDPRRGTCLVGESRRPVPADVLAELDVLVTDRDELFRVTGPLDRDELAEFRPDWAARWGSLAAQVEPLVRDEPQQPALSWLVGINNAVLVGAMAETREHPAGRPPTPDEYVDWRRAAGTKFREAESNVIRVRPGMSSDSKFVGFEHLVAGGWEPPEPGDGR